MQDAHDVSRLRKFLRSRRVSEQDLSSAVDEKTFDSARFLVSQGRIRVVLWYHMSLRAEVCGMDQAVSLIFGPRALLHTICPCASTREGHCVHSVAILLFCLIKPQEVLDYRAIKNALSSTDRENLEGLLLNALVFREAIDQVLVSFLKSQQLLPRQDDVDPSDYSSSDLGESDSPKRGDVWPPTKHERPDDVTTDSDEQLDECRPMSRCSISWLDFKEPPTDFDEVTPLPLSRNSSLPASQRPRQRPRTSHAELICAPLYLSSDEQLPPVVMTLEMERERERARERERNSRGGESRPGCRKEGVGVPTCASFSSPAVGPHGQSSSPVFSPGNSRAAGLPPRRQRPVERLSDLFDGAGKANGHVDRSPLGRQQAQAMSRSPSFADRRGSRQCRAQSESQVDTGRLFKEASPEPSASPEGSALVRTRSRSLDSDPVSPPTLTLCSGYTTSTAAPSSPLDDFSLASPTSSELNLCSMDTLQLFPDTTPYTSTPQTLQGMQSSPQNRHDQPSVHSPTFTKSRSATNKIHATTTTGATSPSAAGSTLSPTSSGGNRPVIFVSPCSPKSSMLASPSSAFEFDTEDVVLALTPPASRRASLKQQGWAAGTPCLKKSPSAVSDAAIMLEPKDGAGSAPTPTPTPTPTPSQTELLASVDSRLRGFTPLVDRLPRDFSRSSLGGYGYAASTPARSSAVQWAFPFGSYQPGAVFAPTPPSSASRPNLRGAGSPSASRREIQVVPDVDQDVVRAKGANRRNSSFGQGVEGGLQSPSPKKKQGFFGKLTSLLSPHKKQQAYQEEASGVVRSTSKLVKRSTA